MQGELRAAKLVDYIEWLEGFIGKGGKVTDYQDFSMLRTRSYYTGSGLFSTRGLGSGIGIIVLPGGKPDPRRGGMAQCTFFFMDGFKAVTAHGKSLYIPVFSDPEFKKLKGVAKFIEDAKKDYERLKTAKR